ncbi:MAG: hypothetical protein OZ921_08935 [Sorangiineae bacterium]|nr:hypothetical protein [Polyangiaceae bacterium]MEB2322626.1 hypothetical protein [Sorangiineae bacterium]
MMADEALEALWKHVLDHWDQGQAHAAFLEHCQRAGALPEAATRYRGMTGDRDRAEEAGRRLGAITALAILQLEASRSAPSPAPKRTTSVVLLVFFILATFGLLLYAYRSP